MTPLLVVQKGERERKIFQRESLFYPLEVGIIRKARDKDLAGKGREARKRFQKVAEMESPPQGGDEDANGEGFRRIPCCRL
jgi:hypothetical protein